MPQGRAVTRGRDIGDATMKAPVRSWGLAVVTVTVVGLTACIQTPREINVDASGWRHERVETSTIPETRNHEEAKAELRKAYGEIERLRKENTKLKEKNEELKRKLKD
jgi:predicted RNase H-like nuclease (RuvC/YqgF family)